jgi:hypothetical protein
MRQNSPSDNSATHNLSKILSNLGNRASATQNPYSLNSTINTITIRFGTGPTLPKLGEKLG